MPTVRDVLRRKGSDVFTSQGEVTVAEVARIMANRGIGSVLIVEGADVSGIFTERDVLRRVVARGKDPEKTPLSEVMTAAPLVAVKPDTTLEECRQLLNTKRIRHLPVFEGSTLAGVVTSGDLLAAQLADQELTIQQLQGFVYDNR